MATPVVQKVPPFTYGTGNPANITAAGLTQTSGAPLTPADVNAYLTQLGSSVNGFTNQVTNALNYLLNSGVFSVYQVRVGVLSQAFVPLNTGSTSGTWMGLAASGLGTVITPQVTGRILAMTLVTVNLETPSASSNTSVTTYAAWSLGKSGPAFGATLPAPAFSGSSATLLGSTKTNCQFEQGITGGTNLQNTKMSFGEFIATFETVRSPTPVPLGQPIWVDLNSAYTKGGSGAAPQILQPTYLILVEY